MLTRPFSRLLSAPGNIGTLSANSSAFIADSNNSPLSTANLSLTLDIAKVTLSRSPGIKGNAVPTIPRNSCLNSLLVISASPPNNFVMAANALGSATNFCISSTNVPKSSASPLVSPKFFCNNCRPLSAALLNTYKL